MTILSKRPISNTVAYADIDDHSFGEKILILSTNRYYLWSVQISTNPMLSNSSLQNHELLFYGGSQSREVVPSGKGFGPQNARKWQSTQRQLRLAPSVTLLYVACYTLHEHPTSDCKLTRSEVAEIIVSFKKKIHHDSYIKAAALGSYGAIRQQRARLAALPVLNPTSTVVKRSPGEEKKKMSVKKLRRHVPNSMVKEIVRVLFHRN